MPCAHDLRITFAALGLTLVLVSCGGGGGGGGPSAPSEPSPTPPPDPGPCEVTLAGGECISEAAFEARRSARATEIARSKRFVEQPDLATIGLDRAHAAIELLQNPAPGDGVAIPGAGARVAILDSGIDLAHPAFVGAAEGQISETLLQGAPDETATGFEAGAFSHGTAVASVIAAQSGARFLGVAPGAEFEAFTRPTGSSGWVAAYRSVLNDVNTAGKHFDFVNASYGVPFTLPENYSRDDFVDHNQELSGVAKEIAQIGRTEKTVFVWAAGNDHGDPCDIADEKHCVDGVFNAVSPSLYAGIVAILDEWRGHNVAVVALGEKKSGNRHAIADLSNRCGIAAEWCIAAPGTNVHVAYFGSARDLDRDGDTEHRGYFQVSGTSAAAPMVTGGLALMKQAFRDQLANTALVTRLFATADKTGIYATRAIYGQGAMDLDAALSPFGVLSLTPGSSVASADIRLDATRLGLGGAFGDGFSTAFARQDIVAFDSLGAPFWRGLSGLATSAGRASALSRLKRLHRGEPERHALGEGWRFGLAGPERATPGLLALAGHAATVSWGAPSGVEAALFTTMGHAGDRSPETGARLAWRPEGGGFALSAGWLGESGSLLGSEAEGAFGGLSADSVALGVETGGALAGWRLRLDAELGMAAPAAGGGWIEEVETIATSAFAIEATRRIGPRDRLTLGLAQPLRAERGRARLTLPVGRTPEGEVLRESVTAGLEPSARQLDLTVGWSRSDGRDGAFRLEAAFSRHPGHSRTASDEAVLLAGWRTAF